MLVAREGQRQRNDLFVLAAQRSLQQRMARLAQRQFAGLGKDRHSGDHIHGHHRLGVDEIHLAQIVRGRHQIRQRRADELREFEEDALDFALLLELQLADLVFQLHHLQRFDEDRLAAGRFVVDKARQALLGGSRHRNQRAAIAD